MHRGTPLGRLAWTSDVPWLDALAAAALLGVAVTFAATQSTAPVQLIGLLLAGGSPLVRRRHPYRCAGLLLAAVLAVALGGPGEVECGEMLPAIALVMFAAGTQRRAVDAAGIGLLGLAALAVELIQDPVLGWGGLVIFAPLALAVWIGGRAARLLRIRADELARRGEELARQRAETARLAVELERDRVSGELQQTISAALARIRATSAGARSGAGELTPALSEIEREGRTLLDDMRSVLGTLRRHGDGPMRAPQPSLREIDRLLEQARARGVAVTLRREGRARAVADAPDRSAYRIIERAVHGTGGPVDVLLRWRERVLELEIRCGDTAAWAELLAAAQERSAICGGRSVILPEAEPGAGVRALLPLSGIRA